MNIFTLMIEDKWYNVVEPIAFFTSREKAETYKHKAQKDKKRWEYCRFFIQEYPVDSEYEKIK